MTGPWKSAGWVTLGNIDIYVCHGALPGPKVLVTAGIHGDEYEGPLAALHLARDLRPEDLSGTVAIVPVANAAAVAAGTRTSPGDGTNMARVFPGDAAGSETQRLAASLFEWAREASFAVDLHSGGVEYDFAPLAGFYGEPVAGNPSFEAARRFGLPYLWKLPITEGTLSYALWRLGIPAIGCEYHGGGRLAPGGAQDYADGILSCLRYWGMLRGAALTPQGQVVYGDWELAASSGFYVAEKPLEAAVRAGEIVARTLDSRGREVERFQATSDGIVLALRSKAFITAGSWGVLSASYV